MVKNPRNKTKRDARRAATVKETAEIARVSPRAVQMVLSGDRENEKVLNIFMTITEEHNNLLKAVKRAVPFN